MGDLSETGPIEVNRPTKSRYGQRRCTAHKKNGERCKNAARLGGTVCGFHGGKAPAVIAKARERLALAADRMARELLGIATGAESEAVKLAAVKDALDRAGLGAKTEVALELRPWEHILNDMAGVAQITREESRARRGLPADTPAPAEPLEVVEAELVEVVVEAELVDDAESPAYRPSAAVGAADRPDRPDRPDAPAHESAPATGHVPPRPRVLTQEEAATVMRALRVRTDPVRRRRRVRRPG